MNWALQIRNVLNMSSELCSVNGIAKSDCGPSRGCEKSFPLKDCNEDVNAHPVSCYLSKERLTEKDLILARAGLFLLSEMQIETMSVCPKHKHSLGRFWRPPRSCQYPGHTGKSTSVAGRHVIGLNLAREIYTLFGQNAVVGSLKYQAWDKE